MFQAIAQMNLHQHLGWTVIMIFTGGTTIPIQMPVRDIQKSHVLRRPTDSILNTCV